MLSIPLGSPMNRNLVRFGMRYRTEKSKNTVRGGIEMAGRVELIIIISFILKSLTDARIVQNCNSTKQSINQ